MKIYRVKPAEMRQWRRNHSVMVDSDGAEVRDATYKEVSEHVTEQSRGRAATFEVDGKTCTVQPWRVRFAQEILRQYGPTQLRRPNGTFMGTVRDPNALEVPIITSDSPPGGIDPETCSCHDWAGREPGRHHIYCQMGTTAPEHQRATGMPMNPIEDELGIEPEDKPPAADEAKPDPIPSPSECICATWVRVENQPTTGHHPMCKWREAWEHTMRPMKFLWSVEGKLIRNATLEEEEEAEKNIGSNGIPMLSIEGVPYIVGSRDWGKDEDVRQTAPDLPNSLASLPTGTSDDP